MTIPDSRTPLRTVLFAASAPPRLFESMKAETYFEKTQTHQSESTITKDAK